MAEGTAGTLRPALALAAKLVPARSSAAVPLGFVLTAVSQHKLNYKQK